jgi:FtsP/CotA-like multicopper oxidase with cupredoxin domain
VDPLPALEAIVAGAAPIELQMREFQASVLPTGFVPPGVIPPAVFDGTWVWGYLQPGQLSRGSYLGPVVVATRGTPTEMRFVNSLGTTATTNVVAWVNGTDQTLHWADPAGGEANACAHMVAPNTPPTPECAAHYGGPIPGVVHLHGGEVPPVLDGGPDAWFLSQAAPGYRMHGHGYYSRDGNLGGNYAIYRYPNSQEAAPIWFHDHVLGATRLNVYAGLAAAYLIVDPLNPPPANLPGPGAIVPLVIQDRMFDTTGQLFFPSLGLNPEHPYWVPEFEGDTIAVNGKVWPFLNVEPRRYRFLFLNGSNARAYEMFLVNRVTGAMGPPLWQIGTDGGYLDAPVKIDPNAAALRTLVMQPGERADVIIDFAGLAPGTRLLLRNTAKHPFPAGLAPRGSTTGRIMEFRVVAPPPGFLDTSYNPATGAPLRAPMIRLVSPATGTPAPGVVPDARRQLTLNEVLGPGGPLELLVNNTKYTGKRPDGTIRPDFTAITVGGDTTGYSEVPNEGATELWEIINLTADAHPIHTHLTQVQLMNRQRFDVKKYGAAYNAAFPGGLYIPGDGPPLDYALGNLVALGGNPDVTPFLKGAAMPPAANEAGWKDTVIMLPGQVTRIMVRYAPTDAPLNAGATYPFDPDGGHGFVWHCHIIDHEDNEMMRPYTVASAPGAPRSYVKGVDY